MELDALETLVAAGRRKAGEAAARTERLSGRAFRQTEDTEALVRVLYEDVPLAIRAQKLAEKVMKQIAAEAERGMPEEALVPAAAQLGETARLAGEALDDVLADLARLEALAE